MISGDRSILQGKKGAFFYTLEEFSKHWDQIDVICPKVPSAKGKVPSPFSNVHFHPNPGGLLSQSSWILKKGKELIAACRHDVMTVHEYPPFYNGFGARKLVKSTGIPYMIEVHHIVGYPVAASFIELIGRWMSRFWIPASAAAAKAVRIVSGEIEPVLMRWGIPEEKIRVLSSFYLDRGALQPNPSIQKKYDVVFCARLVANKGWQELLNAVAKLSSVKLLIIGDGPDRKALEAKVRSLHLSDRVHIAGWLATKEDVYRAIQSGKIFVMNSSSEGGPRVALEAMALGLPIICTNVGIMPIAVEDGANGIFTTGTADDLAEKLQSLLTDTARREKIAKEASTVIQLFERAALIREYANFLKQLSSAPPELRRRVAAAENV